MLRTFRDPVTEMNSETEDLPIDSKTVSQADTLEEEIQATSPVKTDQGRDAETSTEIDQEITTVPETSIGQHKNRPEKTQVKLITKVANRDQVMAQNVDSLEDLASHLATRLNSPR